MDSSVRLNKFLAFQLGISRREADDLIKNKRVKVGNQIAILGSQIAPGDTITIDDKLVAHNKQKKRYVIFNKPVGYVCSRRAQGVNPTIYDILPDSLRDLKTVGRLDKNSSGLIILTNDGDFTYQMTHPSFYKTKIYQVILDKPLEPLHQQMISDFGVKLDDGPSKLQLERQSDNRRQFIVTMHEGRNRQIRRTFAALGYEVVKLHRTNFGNYALGDIKSGEFIETSL